MIRIFNLDKSLDKYYMDVNSLDFMPTYTDSYISGSSIIITKETEGEDSSTFQLLTIPKKDGSRINIMALIDDEPVKKSRFFRLHESENIAPTEVFQELRNWGPDIPADFKRKIGDHLGRNLRVSRDTIETELGFTTKNSNFSGIGVVSINNIITDNIIKNNSWFGVYISGVSNDITYNIISNNGLMGIRSELSNQIIIGNEILIIT